MTKPCEGCGEEIEGARQKRFCSLCRSQRYASTIRSLQPGERVPEGTPRRYVNDSGYMRLRWKVDTYSYVETYEHRIFDGYVTLEEQVHHINRVRDDNRSDNLQPLSAEDHHHIHGDPVWRTDAARLYESGLSTYQVGRVVNRNPATVYRGLVRIGVPMRKEARVAIPHRETAHA